MAKHSKYVRLQFARTQLVDAIKQQAIAVEAYNKDTSSAVVLSRKEALEDLWTDFRSNQSDIEGSQEWDGSTEFMQETNETRELYLKVLSELTTLLPEEASTLQDSLNLGRHAKPSTSSGADLLQESDHEELPADGDRANQIPHDNLHDRFDTTVISVASTTPGIPAMVKLPPLQITVFTGNLIDWPEFKATCETTFTSIMDDVHRFRYFKGYLSGEPARMVKHLPMQSGSYKRAYEILLKRYDNQRAIINANLHRLFEVARSQNESAAALKLLLDTANECVSALNAFAIDTDSWDAILIFILSQRLDPSSIQHWEERIQGQKTVPKFSEFTAFLDIRINVLETTANTHALVNSWQRKPRVLLNNEITRKCTICANAHHAFTCPQLTSKPPPERMSFIESKGLCVNCLHNHKVEACTSRFSCRVCKLRHNTVLHVDERVNHLMISEQTNDTFEEFIQTHVDLEAEELQAVEMSNVFCAHMKDKRPAHVMLATALVRIEFNNRCIYAKALIDQGSTANLITSRICKTLNLPETRISIPIVGVCDTVTCDVNYKTTCRVKARMENDYSLPLQALVVPKITSINRAPLHETWDHLTNLELADPQMDEHNRIDILLGAAAHADILLDGVIKGMPGQPIAQKTELGWIVSGGINTMDKPISIFTITPSDESLSQCLQRFWESEEVPPTKILTPNEKLAEDIYTKTTKRCDDGRFMVKLPFKTEGVPDLGQSFMIAKRRYEYMIKRFASKPEFQQLYDQCIQQYLDLGHMELATESNRPHNYLPHHPVLKESSTTTKVRPVFDASMQTTNKNSLNSQLLIGPTIQPDLFSLFIHWRKRQFAICGDIEQMYRQIWIYPEDTEYLRILWRPPGSTEIKSYKLKTVTFGVASAPFLAIRTLFKIADEISKEAPELAEKIKLQFHVDDYFDSLDTVEEAQQVLSQMAAKLAEYGFTLRKWKSNEKAILSNLNEKEKEITQLNVFKTLGVQWESESDNFLFVPAELKLNTHWTKRRVLSDIAKLFDPLGWLAPCVILAKIFMQELWLLQLGWDEQLPDPVVTKWLLIRDQFMSKCLVKVPRWLGFSDKIKHASLHGFSDASEKALASIVFMRIEGCDGSISCKLVASKTKVAPLKKLSVPRLELKAAVLLTALMGSVKNALKIPTVQQYAWTDSTIVLYWLASHPSRWKTFVANRVAEIQNTLPSHLWRHIESAHNPADCASRGLTRVELEKFKLWWQGPEFLLTSVNEWPKDNINYPKDQNVEEKKQALVAHINPVIPNSMILRFSNYELMLNSIVRCLRWFRMKKSSSKALHQPIKLTEVQEVEKILIKIVQTESFGQEIASLQKDHGTHPKSKIHNLDPFLDSEGILRVGGRIQLANLSEDRKHPIILPPKHHFTRILTVYMHQRTLHGGYALTGQRINQNFWIVNARQTIKSVIYKCVTCFRFRKKLWSQKMGNMPSYRVQSATPFTFTGVDYAGYFEVKSSQSRNAPYVKCYIALFICLTTRAIHLELVSDLSTTQFMKAFKRFIGRRGIPKCMFSDNATNFLGAEREIRLSLEQSLKQADSEVRKLLLRSRIEWSTIPARAPHFGGWESGVKLVKHHLKRVLGNVRLNFEDFNTLIIEIEAVVNSRPLWSLPTTADEFEALTPAHFLIFRPLNSLPEPNLDQIPTNRLNQYQFLQRLLSDFWRLWSKEYVQQLQVRKKWQSTQPNMRPGQIVLVSEDNEHPSIWSLGHITKVYPGNDNLVRAVDVYCRGKELRRPIHKLSILPIPDNEEHPNQQSSIEHDCSMAGSMVQHEPKHTQE